MTHVVFEKVSFDGLRLYYQVWTPDSPLKGLIMLVHGLGEHSGRYTHWAELFNQASYALITYDLRGHGRSDGQRGHVKSFEEYFKDTDMLLKEAHERFPGTQMFLYGHSLGGLIVTNYVLNRKPKLNGVIVSGLSNRTSLQEQKGKVILSKLLGTVVPRMTIATGLIPSTICRDPDVVLAYVNDPLVHGIVTVGWGKAALQTIAVIEQHAGEWKHPVLIMHGELDRLGYPEGSKFLASKINGDCTLKIWPGLYHEVHNEPEKETVFNYLCEWLELHRNA